MSLQKKCFTASAVTHGLLILLVFIGSAFIPQKPKVEVVTFELFTMPDEVTDEPNVFSGGNPNVTEAPAPAPQQAPAPATKAAPPIEVPQPQTKATPPVKEPIKEPTPEPQKPEKVEPPKEENPFDFSKAKRITKPEKTTPTTPPKPNNTFELDKKAIRKITVPNETKNNSSQAEAARANERSSQIAKTLSDSMGRVRGNLSSIGTGTSYDVPGPGGASRASYTAYLIYEYRRAWVSPAKGSSRTPVEAEVVIARDGSVISARVTKKSGSREIDNAAEATLRRVRKFEKAPPGNEAQVTYRFYFEPTYLD